MTLYLIGFAFTCGFLIERDDTIKLWELIVLCFIWPVTLGVFAAKHFEKKDLK